MRVASRKVACFRSTPSKPRKVPDLRLQDVSEDICKERQASSHTIGSRRTSTRVRGRCSFVALQTKRLHEQSYCNGKASSCTQPCLDTTFQNIKITHGGYKRSLVEGTRQTARRGQTNPVWPLMVSCRVSLEVERLRWPQTNGNWHGKHCQVVKYCKAPCQAILEEGQHAVRVCPEECFPDL
jgi:hypothetical protein